MADLFGFSQNNDIEFNTHDPNKKTKDLVDKNNKDVGLDIMNNCNFPNKTIGIGDNLNFLKGINSESVDLFIGDGPYYSKRTHAAPIGSDAEGQSFIDDFDFESLEKEEVEYIEDNYPEMAVKALDAKNSHSEGMGCFLMWYFPRLKEIHRVMKNTGSIYLMCDEDANTYIRGLLDLVFGKDNFINEIVWCYGLGGSSNRRLSNKHDTILLYAKSKNYYFNKLKVPATSNRMKGQMKGMLDFWDDISALNNMANERTGHRTQKPRKLFERMIMLSSRENDLVCDPFMGSGTTASACETLNRNWIGFDLCKKSGDLAISQIKKLGILFDKEPDSIITTEIPIRSDYENMTSEQVKPEKIKDDLYDEQKGLCAATGVFLPRIFMTIDHKDGDHNNNKRSNLQLMAGSMNSKKNKTPVWEFDRKMEKEGPVIREKVERDRELYDPGYIGYKGVKKTS